MNRREIPLWIVASGITVLIGLVVAGEPRLREDSYQYLSTAGSLASGAGAKTAILHYDVDRRTGQIPVPLTMWPPGYPMAVAALRVVGVPLTTGAAAISALSFVALVTLLLFGARAYNLTPTATRLMLLWLLANSWAFVYPVSVSTESLFTAVVVGGIVLFAIHEKRHPAPPQTVPLVIAGTLLGLSYWVRYAGLLLCAGAAAFYGLAWLVKRDRASLRSLTYATSGGALLVALNAVRNIWITGSWKAGYDTPTSHPLTEVLHQFAASLHHLFLGEATAAHLGVYEVIMALCVLFLAGLWVIYQRRGSAGLAVWRVRLLLFTFVAVYSVGIVYIAMTSIITFGTRMFYPLLPLLLLGLAAGVADVERAWVTTPQRRWAFLGVLAAATLAYGAVNVSNIRAVPRSAPHYLVVARLSEPLILDALTPPNQPKPARFSMHAWIDRNIPRDAVVVASDGQATSYAVQRPAVSLVDSGFSATKWTEESVRELMRTYHAEFLILYPRAHSWRIPVQAESPFLAAVLQGQLPSWLTLVADNLEVRVYRDAEAARQK